MTARLVVLAAFLAGCIIIPSSSVLRTRVTADGGEYTMSANSPEGVAGGIGQALAAISTDCAGTYEVTGVELLPVRNTAYGYLDTTLQAAWGPFLTGIAYECRPPASAALNQRLQAIAAAAPVPAPPGSPCLVTNECPPGRVCGLSQAECDSR
jgi:hypothetical protein